MKEQHLQELLLSLQREGFEKEVPATLLKQHLVKYIGIDKYKLKYTLEVLVELGYFSWNGISVLRIHHINGDKE